jgi:hypothetical protein
VKAAKASTTTRIDQVDLDEVRRIASAKGWTPPMALKHAIRKLAEAERIDATAADAPASGVSEPGLSKGREAVGV